MDIVIIEDEIEAAADLRDTIIKLQPDARIVALIDSVETGIEWFHQNAGPDIIFSDIQLGDGLAFDVFKDFRLSCPVVFCTAYDNYAIEAFKNNGIDYLLKPVSEQLLKKSLEKIEMFKAATKKLYSATAFEKAVKEIVENSTTYKSTFLVSYREKIIPIHVSDILLFRIDDNGVKLRTRSSNEYAINYALDELESGINPKDFFRANRQYLISYNAIKEIENYFDRKLLIRLHTPVAEEIIVSKAKATAFLRWLEDR